MLQFVPVAIVVKVDCLEIDSGSLAEVRIIENVRKQRLKARRNTECVISVQWFKISSSPEIPQYSMDQKEYVYTSLHNIFAWIDSFLCEIW